MMTRLWLGSVECSRSIAHLLFEDQQHVLIADLFGDRYGATVNECYQSLEHAFAFDERCSRTEIWHPR
jgi:hypothetical protein